MLRNYFVRVASNVMLRRTNYYSFGLSFAFGLSIFIIYAGNRYAFISYYPSMEISEEHARSSQNRYANATEIRKIFNKTRLLIKRQLSKYNFSVSGAHVLEDLVMESGGQPLRSLIISTWRSGSTFLGELLTTIPGTYYHYEPLIPFFGKQIRGSPEAYLALRTIKDLFNCKYRASDEILKLKDKEVFNQILPYLLKRNIRLWKYCKYKGRLCFDDEYKSQICKLFPFQVMKLIRLRLHLVQELLDDKKLNLKVILLIRDPRGVMQSRMRCNFCHTPDCFDDSLLCADMIRDYVAASRILQEYPDKLMVLRFEELALNLTATAHRIVKFLRLSPVPSFRKFLRSHSNVKGTSLYSTFRVSRKVPFKWKHLLPFEYVEQIQMIDVCKDALHLWGYKMAHNSTHMTSKHFNPLGDYTI